MKQQILYRSFFISLLLATLHACTDEVSVTEEQAIRLTVSVTDGGYLSAAGKAPATRAEEDEYRTKFTAGDKIGLYAVRNSKIVEPYNNLCLTYDGTAWKFPSDDATTYWYEGAVYYAYYPYNSSQTGIDASATNVDGFFANVVSGWTPATDQSTYEKYTDQDLMTGVGTVGSSQADGTRPLSITLTHRMGLVELKLPYKKYTLSTDNTYTWYLNPPHTEFNFTPCRMGVAHYRYIVKPGTDYSLSGSYTNATNATASWSLTANVTAGNCKSYTIDKAEVAEVTYTLQFGDYYCRDENGYGYLLSKETDTDELSKHQCVGVVFRVNKDNSDDSGYPSGLSVHGYAVAMTEGANTTWGPTNRKVGTPNSNTDWKGYKNQQTILNYAGNNSLEMASTFPAAYHCVIYGTASGSGGIKWAAPINSSGWYLPASGQVNSLYQNRATINSLLSKIVNATAIGNGYYWASSENTAEMAYVQHFVDNTSVVVTQKNNNNIPRAVLTF